MAEMTSGRRWVSQDGAELIEFALVLPLLLLLLLGIIDFGLLFQRYQVVTNAAREGARVAVLPGYSDEDVETRVSQFLTAAGLTDPATATVGAPVALSVGGQCIVTRPVTVEYPYTYSAVGALAAYFDGSAFSRSGLRATASMRSELAAGACS
jgi:Flp pilus assembly protein TadG